MTPRDTGTGAPEECSRPTSPGEHAGRVGIGIAVGAASMLPGISGGVVAVCFGIYERLIADLADLRGRLMRDLPFVTAIGSGMLIGVLFIAFLLDIIMDRHLVPALFLFLGLIIGQLPELWRITRPDDGRLSAPNLLALVVGFAFMMLLIAAGTSDDVAIDGDAANFAALLLVGALFAISKLAPGISGSTLILALGLYKPMMDAITDMDIAFLIPLVIGFIIGLLGFAKAVDRAIKRHRTSSYCMILGLTLGSIMVVFWQIGDYCLMPIDIIVGMAALVFGNIVSLLFIRAGNRSNGCDA